MSELPGYPSFFGVLLAALVLGLAPGLAATSLVEARDFRERLLLRLASPGLGLFLTAGVLGMATWVSGAYRPGFAAILWLALTGGLLLAARARAPLGPGRRAAFLLLLGLLSFALGWVVFSPIRDFPVSPDYDGTADGYFAAMIKIGWSYPTLHPLGDAQFLTVNAPPGLPVLGAFVSTLTGVFVARTDLALGGAAWVFYMLALPLAAWPLVKRTAFPLCASFLAGALGYSLALKWTYYDGSNLRLFGILGLTLATAFFLRALERGGGPGSAVGLLLGLLIYIHHRYLLLGAFTMGVFLAGRFAWLSLRRARATDRRELLLGSARMAAAGALVVFPYVLSVASSLGATRGSAFWSSRTFPFDTAVQWIARFIGPVSFIGGVAAAVVVLAWRGRRPEWAYAGLALLLTCPLLSEDFIQKVAPFLRSYLDAASVTLSGFNESRPVVIAAALMAPATWLASRRRSRWPAAAALLFAASGVAWSAVRIAQAPVSACYAYLTPGDYRAMAWLRRSTPREGTLILAYAWDDLPAAELAKDWSGRDPRRDYNMESFWVTPVAERRSVFHWLNRHLHQKAWNVVRAQSPGYLEELLALHHAYMNPDEPESERVMRAHCVTHIYVTPFFHEILWEKLLRSPYLAARYVDPPPFSGYFGRPDQGFRPLEPIKGAAIYEVLPNAR